MGSRVLLKNNKAFGLFLAILTKKSVSSKIQSEPCNECCSVNNYAFKAQI